MHMLINGGGQVVPATPASVRHNIDFGPRSVEECCRFLVTNLGYVSVKSSRRGVVVEWRPTFVRRETFVALITHLSDMSAQRVLVSTLKQEWMNALHPTPLAAAEALRTTFNSIRSDDEGYFRARARCGVASSPALSAILGHTQDKAFEFEPFDLWRMLDAYGNGRYTVLEPQEGRLRILAQGRGFPNMGQAWLTGASGRDFFDQPDASYARSTARGYWSVWQSRLPLVEDVEASVWWTAQGRSDIAYTRLILPINVVTKGPVLLALSELRLEA